MIFCFSGTGNSRYIAGRISEALKQPVDDLNARIKAGNEVPVETGRDVIVVMPTYAWRIPRIVDAWLSRVKLIGAERIWFVMDCGGEIGAAAKYNRRLSLRKGLCDMGTAQIVMPENYIAMFGVPQAEEARKIVERAEPSIRQAILRLRAGEPFAAPRARLVDSLLSGPVNPIFYRFFVKADAFTAGGGCIGCGRCAEVCPLNNIRLQDGRPVWGSRCTHCMACICHCPTEAIEYGKKSAGKPRYRFDRL